MQSSTWGWASTQLGMNYDVMDAEGYVSGTILTITSMGSGGTIVVGQYAYFFKSNMASNGTRITAFGTGSGDTGTYILNTSQATVGSAGSPIKITIFSLKLNRPDIANTGATTGTLGFPTLAPNGLLYIPYNITTTTSSTTFLTGFVVIEPGNANTKTPSGINTSYTRTKIYTVDNNNSGNRPVVPENLATTNRDRTFTKGILAPNGLIYFIPGRSKTMIVLNPGTGIVGGVPDCTWSLVDFRVATCTLFSGLSGIISNITLGTPGHAGGVLDKLNADIYLINANNNERTIRIRPRSSATWTNPNNGSLTTDIFEAGYYDSSVASRRLVRLPPPASHLGTLYNSNNNYILDDNSNTTLFKGGVIDPNPSSNIIYLTPSRSNLIMYIDPNKWRLTTEVDYDLTNALNTVLNFPTWSNLNDTSFGNFKYSGLSIGYDKRIYYAYRAKTQTGNGQLTYFQTVAWDMQLDTTSSPFVSRKVKNNIPPNYQQVSNGTGQLTEGLCPPALLPNKKFLYFGQRPDANNVYLLPTSDTVQTVSSPNDTINSTSTGIYFRPGQGGDSFSGTTSLSPFMGANGLNPQLMLLTKPEQIGKVIISSRSASENAIEVMSVKGFFPGVKNFEYDQDIIDRQSIPSDLSTLPTHPYNYYGNWT